MKKLFIYIFSILSIIFINTNQIALADDNISFNNVNAKNETDKTAYQAPYFADTSKSILANKNISV